MNKMADKVSRVYQNRKAMDEFFFLLINFDSIVEFEDRWD